MKKIYLILVLFLVLLSFACKKTPSEKSLAPINLNYDSLLVKDRLMLSPTIKVAHLKEWLIDDKASEGKENMLFFQNTNLSGMITIKGYMDGNATNYLKEVEPTFAGKEIISKSNYTFQGKNYHHFMVRSQEYIILKAVIEIDENNYVDTNLLFKEENYLQIKAMIETYLASIAIMNQ
jgi:hypothetical protein